MYNHIKGFITHISPTNLVIEANGVGYLLQISLNTYTKIKDKKGEVIVLCTQIIREDSHTLYGFADELERTLFKHLISVSGIGPNTALVILSSYQPGDIIDAIVSKNAPFLQSIKGIGAKSAQRIIVELQDKLAKESITAEISTSLHNTNKQEALSALVVLGFSKMQVEKIIDKIISENPELTSEEIIRKALQML